MRNSQDYPAQKAWLLPCPQALCVVYFLMLIFVHYEANNVFGQEKDIKEPQRGDIVSGKAPTPLISKTSFVKRQLEAYKKALARSEAQVQEFKQKHSLTSLESQQQLLLQQRKELDTLLKGAVNNISALDTKLSWLKHQIQEIPEKVPLSSVTNRQAIIQEAQKNLLDLQLKEQEILTKFHENSRTLMSVRKEIELVQGFLEKQKAAELENMVTTGKNPVFQELEIEILRTEAQLVSDKSRRMVTQQQIAEIDQELLRLNNLEKEFRELLRTVTANERNFEEYLAMVGTTPLEDYRIQVGDLLDVKFFFNPDLNQEASVRPDGRISLQLIGEVMASGLTVEELTKRLKRRYDIELKNPSITVILRSFNQKIDASSRTGLRPSS
ncbi:MAG: polysaccharide biosynthesis/export family protein [Nitrospirales bacterium]|nr:polysaccharide biosynthesis/export family protein [Nitrospira sp.]MDR4502682.1 polysaccharide biosynthesis/export family protein [Nitrospirales bacterium]